MGQKAHPIGNRLGIIRGWDSNWFGGNNYSDKLVEDEKIRKYISVRIAKGGISKVVIERTLKRTPGVESAAVNYASEKATVTIDPAQVKLGQLQQRISDAGYQVVTAHVDFPVGGMTCTNCSNTVERTLKRVPGVVSARKPACEKTPLRRVASRSTFWNVAPVTPETP